MKIPFQETFLRIASANFTQGVDFSVAEATASNTSFMAMNGIATSHSLSLDVQYECYRNFSRAVYSGIYTFSTLERFGFVYFCLNFGSMIFIHYLFNVLAS